MQASILNPISCYGIGAHSGRTTQLTLKTAPENTGIVFIRTDVTSVPNHIVATYDNVSDTLLSTTIANEHKVQVSTIEHLMAAIWGCGIDNLIVEIDGPEVPIMDGSSKPFVFMIECAGRKIQNAPQKIYKLTKEVRVIHKDCELIASPAEGFSVDLTIDFKESVIGKQNIEFSNGCSFKDDISNARTFGFVSDLEYLRSKGLALGSSLDNAIGIDAENNAILNHDGLRHENEFVRHKLLDLIGDFNTSGGILLGKFIGYKTGHALNNQFLRTLFSDSTNYSVHSRDELIS